MSPPPSPPRPLLLDLGLQSSRRVRALLVYVRPTNISSLNLVMGCSKVFFYTIPTPALAYERYTSDILVIICVCVHPIDTNVGRAHVMSA